MSHGKPIKRGKASEYGLTLIEILVAMAVFGIACLIAYKGLDAVSTTKQSLDTEIRFWREIGLAFERAGTDFLQAETRPMQTNGKQLTVPMRGATVGTNGFFIDLIRLEDNRTPIHINYQCDNGVFRLTMLSDQTVVTESNSAPPTLSTTLIQNIEQCDATFLNGANVWLNSWPADQALVKPRAIKLRFAIKGRGRFERIYYLP